jgi:N-acetylneuraminic acid mutarotase
MKWIWNFLRPGLLLIGTSISIKAGAQTTGWHWMGGESSLNVAAVVHSTGQPDSLNTPGSRTSYASWTDANGNFWLFGGTDGNGGLHNDLWKQDKATHFWVYIAGPVTAGSAGVYGTKGVADLKNVPPPRTGTCGFADPAGTIWIFGGHGQNGELNDLWAFDGQGRWTWVSGDDTAKAYAVYGHKGATASGNKPGARTNMWGGADQQGNIWIFAGQGFVASGAEGPLNDLWEYSPAEKSWTWMTGDAYTNSNGQEVTFEGQESPYWWPGAVRFPSGWIDREGNFWVFGGIGKGDRGSETCGCVPSGYLNDIWRYNPRTGSWGFLSGSGVVNTKGIYQNPNGAVGGRYGQTITQDGDGNVWMFGGTGYDGNGKLGVLNDLWEYVPSSNQWIWVGGSDTASSPSSYSTKQDPGGRTYAGSWIDTLGNFWIFGGWNIANKALADWWEYNLNNTVSIAPGSWTWISGDTAGNSPGNFRPPVGGGTPGARDGHSAVVDPNTGNFWIFGGNGFEGMGDRGTLDDLWSYSPTDSAWTLRSGIPAMNVSGSLGTQPTRYDAGNRPGGRTGQSALINAAQQTLYIFGGSGLDTKGANGDLNDLWGFQAGLWALLGGSATVNQSATANFPGARYGQASAMDGSGKLWIFGGNGIDANGNAHYLGDVWTYDPNANKWTWITDATSTASYGAAQYGVQGEADPANTPGAREYASIWIDGKGKLWLFGGSVGYFGYLDDLWELDPVSKQWTWVKGDSNNIPPKTMYAGAYGIQGVTTPANNPGSREMQSVVVDKSGNFWLYGGQGYDANNQLGALGDLWKYDPNSNQWTWVSGSKTANATAVFGTKGTTNTGNNPGGRISQALWLDATGNLWLMGGLDGAGRDHNDLWKFAPANPVSLPIKEVVLSGVSLDKVNRLGWQTIDELNTDHFVVERSLEGTRFDSVGIVAAVGSGDNNYSFADQQLPASPVFFYRLDMIDKDGNASYSQTIMLHAPTAAGLSLYPNPARDIVILQLKDNSLVNTPLSVLDIGGHLIKEVLITGQQQTITLPGLARGTYLLRLANGTALQFLKE